jgi:hypothetical protein
MSTLVAGLAAHLGLTIADSRRARRWTLRQLGDRAGLSAAAVHAVEHGRPASMQTYAAIGDALGLALRADLVDPRRRASTARAEDPVHAAMGETIARRMAGHGFTVAIDEPYQHYQFAGRADLLAWDSDARHVLHVENRTRFPNVQEAIGSYNAKRRYLPAVVADRLGRHHGFESVTNVIAALWSSEAIHTLRLRSTTFAAVCPDAPDAFVAWWNGEPRPSRVVSTLILLDPAAIGRHRTFAELEPATRARYRGYADAAAAIASREASGRS